MEDVQTEIAYAGSGGWLEVAVRKDGDQFAISNHVDHAVLMANRYVATVSVSASGTDNSPQSYVVMLDVATSPQPDARVPDTSSPDASWVVPDAGASEDAGSSARRPSLDDQIGVLSGGCDMGSGSAPASLAVPLLLALVLALRRRRGHR